MFIALTGRAGVGKTTVAEMLVKKFGFVKISLADPIRKIAKLFGFKIEKPYSLETRMALQAIGYTGRLIDKDIWAKMLIERVKELLQAGVDKIVVDDVRFSNECALLKAFGFYIVKIEISEEELQKRMGKFYVPMDVESEKEIAYIPADLIIDGTLSCEEIINKIFEFVDFHKNL